MHGVVEVSPVRRAGAVLFGALVLWCCTAAQPAWAATQTYGTPGSYSFTVPAGVTSIYVNAIGAAGGSCYSGTGGKGPPSPRSFR